MFLVLNQRYYRQRHEHPESTIIEKIHPVALPADAMNLSLVCRA